MISTVTSKRLAPPLFEGADVGAAGSAVAVVSGGTSASVGSVGVVSV